MIKMAQLEDIRKMYFLEELSIREISKKTGHHRDTISKYVNMEKTEPPVYKRTQPREHPVLGSFIPIIDEILQTDQTRHRKQRHTGQRVFERLRDEYGFNGGYTTVTDYLRKQRPKIKDKRSIRSVAIRNGAACRSRLGSSTVFSKRERENSISICDETKGIRRVLCTGISI